MIHRDGFKIGEEKSEQLEYIPASLKVIETLRPNMHAVNAEHATATPIVIGQPHPQKYGDAQLAGTPHWQ